MSNTTKPSEAVQKAITEHAAMSEFVRNLDETVAIWNAKEVGVKVNAIRVFLQKRVTDHFAFEDQTIFSGLLAASPDAGTFRVVTALQNDHKAISKEVGKLHELLTQAEQGGDTQVIAQLEMAFRMLLGRLQRHAAEEDKLFAALSAKRG